MVSKNDREAFAEAVRDVKPLDHEPRVTRTRPQPSAVARHSRAARQRTLEASLETASVEFAGDEVAFRRPAIDERTFSRLRAGRFSIEAEIDLHGMTRLEAEAALKAFIADAAEHGLGCVRVIHGKGSRSGPGGPVLKAQVAEWLTRWEEVLAVSSAQPRHGGTGAVYVLVKRR